MTSQRGSSPCAPGCKAAQKVECQAGHVPKWPPEWCRCQCPSGVWGAFSCVAPHPDTPLAHLWPQEPAGWWLGARHVGSAWLGSRSVGLCVLRGPRGRLETFPLSTLPRSRPLSQGQAPPPGGLEGFSRCLLAPAQVPLVT